MEFHRFAARTAFLLAAVLAGCATDPGPSAPAPGTVGSAPPRAPAPVREVPHLKVALACGACVVPDEVRALIGEGCTEAATKAGFKVTPGAEAVLTIVEYQARNPGARAMFGVFAGKDLIKANVAGGGGSSRWRTTTPTPGSASRSFRGRSAR